MMAQARFRSVEAAKIQNGPSSRSEAAPTVVARGWRPQLRLVSRGSRELSSQIADDAADPISLCAC
jgi:hypothetical protein